MADLGSIGDVIPGVCLNFNNYFLDLLRADQAYEVLSKVGSGFFEESAVEKILGLVSVSSGKDKVEPSLLSLFCHELVENIYHPGKEISAKRYSRKRLTRLFEDILPKIDT